MIRKERDGEIRKVFGMVEIQLKQVWKMLIQQGLDEDEAPKSPTSVGQCHEICTRYIIVR